MKKNLINLRDRILLQHSGLFDEEYYLSQYPDVRFADISPIKHFVEIGWTEFRNPCEYFDTKYYLQNYPDIEENQVNPVIHYLRHGWKEKRNPSKNFDTGFYLSLYEDVREANVNPLAHYMKFGRKEGRIIRNAASSVNITPSQPTTDQSALVAIPSIDQKKIDRHFHPNSYYSQAVALKVSDLVDIVICVGPNQTHIEDCINSIREFTTPGTYKIHLVLHELDLPKLRINLTPDMNLHIHTMEYFNYSIANNLVLKDIEGDVVLLNDDTEVTKNWLDLLKRDSKGFALTGARTGIQRSGNPDMWGEGSTRVTDSPINMFCAYIPAKLRSVVGLLNEEYVYYGGEDVDYSIRALQNGFPLVVSEAFVQHKDNQSFKDSKNTLIVESDKLLYETYQVVTPFNLSGIIPKVSVIMATRNRPEMVVEAIESIESIDYPNFELIVIDDGSDLATKKVLFEQQQMYENIIVVRLPKNKGAANARNLGIQMSKGQFLFITDDDDTVLSNRIKAPLSYLMQNLNLDVVYCDYNLSPDGVQLIPVQCSPFERNAYLKMDFYIGLGILLGRTKVFKDVPLHTRFNLAGDYDWVFRIMRAGYRIDHFPGVVMNYNRSGPAESHLAGTTNAINSHFEVYSREKSLELMKRK